MKNKQIFQNQRINSGAVILWPSITMTPVPLIFLNMELYHHLNFERIFSEAKTVEIDKATYLDHKKNPEGFIFLGFDSPSVARNFSSIRELCRAMFIYGVKSGETETIQSIQKVCKKISEKKSDERIETGVV